MEDIYRIFIIINKKRLFFKIRSLVPNSFNCFNIVYYAHCFTNSYITHLHVSGYHIYTNNLYKYNYKIHIKNKSG